jgi:hypothetical protein
MSDETADNTVHDDFWLSLARDAYTSSSNFFDTNVRNRIIQDIKQFQSEHPDGSKYFTDAYKLKSKLFRPKTRTAIRKNEAIAAAAYFSTEDVTNVRPMDDNEPLQLAAAAFHKSLLQYRLTRPYPHGLPWFLTCLGAYQEAQSIGVVGSYQFWNVNERKKLDRVDCMLLPVENYRFDPAADWRDVVNSSPYFIILWPMYVKDVMARMKPGADGKSKWRKYSKADIIAAGSGSYDAIRMAREGNGTDSKTSNTADSDYTVVWVHEIMIEVEGVDVTYYTLGSDKLLSDPALIEDKHPQGRPAVVGFSILEAHKVYPSSACSLTKDIQTEINDVANMRIDNVKLMMNKRYFATRNKNVDLRSLTRNIPSSVTMMDNVNDVRVITTDDATSSSYQEQDRLNLDFDDISGSFSGSSVASNRRLNETVGGMNLLSSSANQVSEYQLRTFTETWVEPVLRQFIVLNQHFETDELVLRMAGKLAGIDQHGFDEATEEMIMQAVMLTVNVGVGATNPQTQLERFVFAMKALAEILGPGFLQDGKQDEIIKEVFGKCGYKDGARFFKKKEEGQPEDPRIAQMAKQIQELSERLQAKVQPEMLAAQVDKLHAETEQIRTETTNKNVEALFSAMNTAEKAVMVPGITPVADAIARSAGFKDMDAAPIYPQGMQPQNIPTAAQIPSNSSPMFPGNPSRGMLNGMESGQSSARPVQYDNEQQIGAI